MQPNVVLPLLSALLSVGFAGLLVRRFARRRRTYHLVWSFALLCFGVSSGAESVGAVGAWSEGLYRWWYLTGAICVAAFLGTGSLYFHQQPTVAWLAVAFVVAGSLPALASGFALEASAGLVAAAVLAMSALRSRARFADAVLAVLVFGTLAAGVVVLGAPLDAGLLPRADEIATGEAFGANVRILTPMFNIPGALVLLLGAAASVLQLRQSRARVAANMLIALGAFVPSLASSLTRFGESSEFYIGQLVGVLCLLAGFMLSDWKATARPRLRPSV